MYIEETSWADLKDVHLQTAIWPAVKNIAESIEELIRVPSEGVSKR